MKSRYRLRKGEVPFTRRLLSAMLHELGVEGRFPVDRFYEQKPILEDGIPFELLVKPVSLDRLKAALGVDCRRINTGFWALNRTLLKRHGLRVLGFSQRGTWYRQFVLLDTAKEVLASLPKEIRKRISEAQLIASTKAQRDLQGQILAVVVTQNELAEAQASWATGAELSAFVVEKLQLSKKEIRVRKVPLVVSKFLF